MTDDLLQSLKQLVDTYGWDALALTGLALLEWGLAQVSPCLALVALGLVLIALGLWGAKLWAKG